MNTFTTDSVTNKSKFREDLVERSNIIDKKESKTSKAVTLSSKIYTYSG